MRTLKKSILYLLAVGASCCSFAAAAVYPERPITLVVPSVPGGAADAVARVLADDMSKTLGQAIIVENRPGTGGVVGTKFVSNAVPDGYTLIFGFDTAMTITPYLVGQSGQPPYEPTQDFVPIGQIGTVQYMLVSSPKSGLDSIKTLLEQTRSSPGKLSYASGGIGSNHHMAMESFIQHAGIQLQHIPYKAAPQGFSDLMGGHVSVMFIANGTGVPAAAGGKVIALGTASAQEQDGLVPLNKSVPGFSYESWFGLFAPSNTSSEAVDTLAEALRISLEKPAIAHKMKSAGVLPAWTDKAKLAARMAADSKANQPLIALFKQNG